MTTKRYDNHSTEFGLWLRGQLPEQQKAVNSIDSGRGFVATNIDYLWRNYKTGKWMLLEEKRYNSYPKRWQKELMGLLHKCSLSDPNYCGIYLLQFSNTNPDDGDIMINGVPATADELLELLRFENIDKYRNGKSNGK